MRQAAAFVVALAGLIPFIPAGHAGEKLTLDEALSAASKCRAPGVRPMEWLDGSHYLAFDQADGGTDRILVSVDARTGAKTPYLDPAVVQKSLATLPGIGDDGAKSMARGGGFAFSADRGRVMFNAFSDLFVWTKENGRARRLTDDPGEEVGESFSPDGSMIAYVSDWNLWVVGTDGGKARALTTEGHENLLTGRLDWVYQEEIYGRGNFGAYWWSPDSKRIAFLQLDESKVPDYAIVRSEGTLPSTEHWRYPRAGQPNPTVKVGVVAAAGGAVKWLDLSRYAGGEILVSRVSWTPDAKQVVLQVQDRIQTWLDVVVADPRTGKIDVLFRDRTSVWIEPNDGPYWFDAGERFVWPSERDGFKHLYVYARDGKLERRLTEGPFEIDDVHAIDESKDVVWVSTDKDDVKGKQLYTVPLDGGAMTRITQQPGSHAVKLSTDSSLFFDEFSALNDPGFAAIGDATGAEVRRIGTGTKEPLAKYGLREPEFGKVKTRDGFEMEAMLILPPDHDPAKRYPVVSYTYGGPHAPSVADSFAPRSYLWHQMLAQEGYVIWVCDNRSASGKGLASVQGVYKNLGEQELRDLEDGIDYLVAQGIADPARIAIWGWSYGGTMAAYALTHSTKFKVGIAGAPVTDWSMYDSIYTERFMDMPQNNPEGYAKSSVTKAAANLNGKLLLMHGTIDENVHMQNSLQFIEALQRAGKSFDVMLYPGNRHGIGDPLQRKHQFMTMTEFIREHL